MFCPIFTDLSQHNFVDFDLMAGVSCISLTDKLSDLKY